MDELLPPVVAVVVAHDPGVWFEETLASLAAQDYPELAVLVLDVGGDGELTTRVAGVLPDAFVRHLGTDGGFGPSANLVGEMVEGASYYLFCHDDVVLDPDAVHIMVEESFRSNAGIVSPKIVRWDDPAMLLHVGMSADKTGSVVDRVQPGEIDHGQYDAVRDVFVAPGGCMLVRADLFAELGGFAPEISSMGEDLDLSWRAQVAGARVVVAPDARIRHRETMAAGDRLPSPGQEPRPVPGPAVDGEAPAAAPAPEPDASPGEPVAEPAAVRTRSRRRRRSGRVRPGCHRAGRTGELGRTPPTLQELQRRHELFAVLSCYSRFHLLRVVPQAVVLAMGEVVVAELTGERERARAVVGAWAWNLRNLGPIRRRRAAIAVTRRVPDREIRALMVRGSERLSVFGRRLVEDGEPVRPGSDEEPAAPTGVSGASGGRSPSPASGRRRQAIAWVVATVVVLLGTRGILTGAIPSVGQFVPYPSLGATFGQFVAGWHPAGIGTTVAAPPSMGLTGVLGTLLVGSMGLTGKVLILAPIPLGAWGMVRLARPLHTAWAGTVAGIAYLAMPLAWNDVALGRFDGLVAYGITPWALVILHRSVAAADDRRRFLRSVLGLGVLEAIGAAYAPPTAIVVLGLGLVVAAGALVTGAGRPALRPLVVALGATATTAVLCLPWLIGVVASGKGGWDVLGLAGAPPAGPTWGALLRFAPGPIGGSPLVWGFAVAAVLALLVGRDERYRTAVRAWVVVLGSWVAAWVSARGWSGHLALDPAVLLAPAAAALALAVGCSIAAFEVDLRARVFGWRQLATALTALAAGAGALPVLASALPGRWDLPQVDLASAVSWMHPRHGGDADFRVLWLGAPASLNQAGWPIMPGLAYATSVGGAPDATWGWSPGGPGPAGTLGTAVAAAQAGRTDQLGALLAGAGVRYVAVVTALAPVVPGIQTPLAEPVPATLQPALARQVDLRAAYSQSGITVYENTSWIPIRSVVPGRVSPVAPAAPGGTIPLSHTPGAPIVTGAVPALPGMAGARSYSGTVQRGLVLAAMAPSGAWGMATAGGAPVRGAPLPSGGVQFVAASPGTVTLAFHGSWLGPAGVAFEIVAWLVALALLVGRRRLRVSGIGSVVAGRLATMRAEPAGHVDWDPDLDPDEVAFR